ncbi:MAG: NADP-dependent isocitrate dehydrogenase [Nitrososphaerota archaeon]|nr:NADP-dependent isocitrate dehydrogenase [Nitrososphaerota archaeon]MDG6927713.1 NADP-dependent isocitrate dehydrogenase [Nitrososphaerota archaeon]MDG6930180.1 NADP-dependent isocitrate dehydrogenase [Nitrososphaerota archaeon]MDG6932053.1 NADP-dependent isocitrate dehydrogenase [Nitrososphaerota archaeon]MDG6935428.1 NADP-dependent isocitrate dehydrogenase [Nitrososphaerota archaeon]
MMDKIGMDNAVVEMDGDEMTRVIWSWVKESLLMPYVDLKTEYYDLHVKHRDETDDQVTYQAGEAIKRLKVGIKCATITPNAERVKEYNLKKEWPSPNATIRKILDGTIFRAPIVLNNVMPAVRFWKKPIVIARHAFGDIYDAASLRFETEGEAEILFRHGSVQKSVKLPALKGAGVIEAKYNIDNSIYGFARASFNYALMYHLDLWFATKDTISKVYDARFKQIFQETFEKEFKQKFDDASIHYNYYLIDDALARSVRSEGGFVWACKNYEGDIISDLVSTAYVGTLALMTSELMSPEGYYESEAAHGTVQRHYYRYLKGEKVSTNPTAIIFAWTRGLERRAKLDGNQELYNFSLKLEDAVKLTIEKDRIMTQDVANVAEKPVGAVVDTQSFISAVKANLDKMLGRA